MSKNYVEPKKKSRLLKIKDSDQIRLLNMKDLDQIKLNVGGHKFETSADTLKTCESFFSTLVTSDIPQKVDADNYVFIDRNGVNFGKILDFMRMRTIDFGHNIELAKAIRVEADFYQFQELIEKCDEFIASPAANLFAYERIVYTIEERNCMIATGKPIVFLAIGGGNNGFISFQSKQDAFDQAVGTSFLKMMNLRNHHLHITFVMDYTPTNETIVSMDFYIGKSRIRNVVLFNAISSVMYNIDMQILEAVNLLSGKMIEQLTGKPATVEVFRVNL